MPELVHLVAHHQPAYLPHSDLTISGQGVAVGIDSFTPRKVDKVSSIVPITKHAAPAFSTPNRFSRSNHSSGNFRVHPNYPPGKSGQNSNYQPTLGAHPEVPGLTRTRFSAPQKIIPSLSTPTIVNTRQFQTQPAARPTPTTP